MSAPTCKKTAARHIGTILREARRIASANLDGAPQAAVDRSLVQLRAALDSLSALWGKP